MPRRSLPSSTAPAAGPSTSLSRSTRETPVVEISSSRTPRSSSRRLSSSPLAHRTTDELALAEADKFLHSGPTAKAHDLDSLENPRNARHRHLEEARRKAEEEAEGTHDDADEEREKEVSPALTSGALVDHSLDASGSGAIPVPSDDEEGWPGVDDEAIAQAGFSDREDESSSASSDEDSDDDSDSDSSDTDTDEEEDEEEEEMRRLLAAAKATAIARAAGVSTGGGDGFAEQEDVLDLHVETKEDLPIPDIAIPNMPKSHLQFTAAGSAKVSRPEAASGPSRIKPKSTSKQHREETEHNLELDDRPYEKKLSKKERQAQPKKASTSELWATLPSAKSDLLPQMKRDYQALALSNSLDPKRFMKGNNKLSKVPERFAIGTIIDAPRTLQRTTLQKEYRYRPGEIVRDLVKDQEAEGYAKRKYEELQWAKMDQGRKKGFRQRGKW